MHIDIPKVVQKLAELYPESITKKPTVNAKHLYKRVRAAFVDDAALFDASYEDLVLFCNDVPARIEFLHAVFESADAGDRQFREAAKNIVKRIVTAMNMTKEMADAGHRIHLATHVNKLVYDLILKRPRPVGLFASFEEATMDETRGNKEYARKSVNRYIPSHPELEAFNRLFDEKYDKDMWYVRWSKTHPFRAEVYARIVEWVTKRTQTSSMKPDVSSAAAIARYVTALKLMAGYVTEHINPPKNVDCLQWFFSTANIDQLNKALIHIVEYDVTVKNERVKSTTSAHAGTEFVYAFVSLAKNILVKYFSNKQDIGALNVGYVLSSSFDRRVSSSTLERRHFLPSEIHLIEEYVATTQNSMWQLAFVILKEVGLRIYALTSLKVSHFLNSKGVLVDSTSVLEKQRRWRTFVVSDTIKSTFRKYLEEFPDNAADRDRYLFRSQTSHHTSRYAPETISHNIKQICNDAGVVGNFVHVHAFRHTLVNSLMQCGNKIENVSKYMGHASVTTTERYYWTDNISNVVSSMNVPWLKIRYAMPVGLEDDSDESDDEEGSVASPDDKCAQCDVLFHLLLVYHRELTDSQKANIKMAVPNIENIFDTMCASSLPTQGGEDEDI